MASTTEIQKMEAGAAAAGKCQGAAASRKQESPVKRRFSGLRSEVTYGNNLQSNATTCKVARTGIEPATHGFSIPDARGQKTLDSQGNEQKSELAESERMRQRMQFVQNEPISDEEQALLIAWRKADEATKGKAMQCLSVALKHYRSGEVRK